MKKRKALTLIETTIAIFVLLVGVVSILQLYPVGLKTSRFSYHLSVASALAQGKAEEMLAKNFEEVTSVPRTTVDSSPSSPFHLYDWEAKVSWVDPNNNLAESQTKTQIKRIEIIIYWKEGGQSKEYHLNTLYAQK